MAFTAKILSWRFLFAQKKAYQAGGVTSTPGPPPPLATPLIKRPKLNGTPPLQPRFSMIYVWVNSKPSSWQSDSALGWPSLLVQ